ncbi:MAG TPA: hypothetical protein VLC12_09790, partial [Terriglobales bacterium]|nr:hypothetical protein [Terriglobales bacterium]
MGRGIASGRVSVFAGFVVGIALLLMPASLAGQTLVQSAANPGSLSVSVAATQNAGDLNIVVIGWSNVTSSVTSVTDTAGNTYVPAVGVSNHTNISQAVYYAKNIAAFACSPGCNAVSVAFNQTPATPDIRVYEFSGMDVTDPLDTSVSNSGSGTSASSGSATTNSANDLLIAA